jgi:hypothetical protein
LKRFPTYASIPVKRFQLSPSNPVRQFGLLANVDFIVVFHFDQSVFLRHLKPFPKTVFMVAGGFRTSCSKPVQGSPRLARMRLPDARHFSRFASLRHLRGGNVRQCKAIPPFCFSYCYDLAPLVLKSGCNLSAQAVADLRSRSEQDVSGGAVEAIWQMTV